MLCAWTDGQFRELCELTDFGHLAADPKFATRALRQLHAESLNELFAEWVAQREPDEALRQLRNAGIPAAPIRSSLVELLTDPQVMANHFMAAVEHPTLGRLWQAGPAFEIDGVRAELRVAPFLGEHTDSVLSELGLQTAPSP